MAGPLRGGGGGKGPAIKEKRFFEKLFKKILLQFKNINYFTLDNLLQYFPKNRAILVQKLNKKKNLSKSVSGYLKTNRN